VDPHRGDVDVDNAGMTANAAGTTPEEIETYDQLLAAIDGLRISGARGHQKLRLSVRDVASGSGVPRSSVASYLTGKVVMPYDQFNAIVTSLGVTADQHPGWESAWRRAYQERTSAPRSQLVIGGEDTRPAVGGGRPRGEMGRLKNGRQRNLLFFVIVTCALAAVAAFGFSVAGSRRSSGESVHALTTTAASSFPYPVPSPGRLQRCSAPIADTDGACVARDGTYIYADFYAVAAKSWALTLQQCGGDGTGCVVIATSEGASLAWPAASGHNYRALASWTDRNGRRHEVGSPAISVPIPR
jgi:hypothetical protein